MLTDHEHQADTNRYGLTEHELAADREAMKAREALADSPVERLFYTLDLDTSEAEAKLDHLSAMSSRIENLTKPWYTSKGIWGGVLAAVSPILGFIGYEFGPDKIETWSVLLAAVGAAVGGVLAAYGRFKAEKVIGWGDRTRA